MENFDHYRKLERMYESSPIYRFYQPDLKVGDGTAEIVISLIEAFHHAAGAVHGSVYFKMLDDAAYFAANSLEKDVFCAHNKLHHLPYKACLCRCYEKCWQSG